MQQDAVTFQNKRMRAWVERRLSKLEDAKRKQGAKVISTKIYDDIIDHFKNQRGPHNRWKSWSPGYRQYMASIGKGGNRILQDTGNLRQSFKPSNYRVESEGFVWYNNAKTSKGFPYAYAHNTGGPKLPKREFMWLSEGGLKKVMRVLLGFIMDKRI